MLVPGKGTVAASCGMPPLTLREPANTRNIFMSFALDKQAGKTRKRCTYEYEE